MNIILCHGFLGFSKIGPVDYFRGVIRHFRDDLHHNVIAPRVDPTQGVAVRGAQLRGQIEQAFTSNALVAAQPTHIIAHSMGGLDARFILSPNNQDHLQAPVRSLTTISTPHRGSLIADILEKPEHAGAGAALAVRTFEAGLKLVGISLDGLRNLTTQTCLEFNSKFTVLFNAGRPRCHSLAGGPYLRSRLRCRQSAFARALRPSGKIRSGSGEAGTVVTKAIGCIPLDSAV